MFFGLGVCRLMEARANVEFGLLAIEIQDDDGQHVFYDARLRTKPGFGCNQHRPRRAAQLHSDWSTQTDQPMWWVDLSEDCAVAKQQQFEHHQMKEALQLCADWVEDGLILQMQAGECQRTYAVKDRKVVDDGETEAN